MADGKTFTPRTISMLVPVLPTQRGRSARRRGAPIRTDHVVARAEAQQRRGAVLQVREHELAGGTVSRGTLSPLGQDRPLRMDEATGAHCYPPALRTRPRARLTLSLSKATWRDRYFMPQSGAREALRREVSKQRPQDAVGDNLDRLDLLAAKLDDAKQILLPPSRRQHGESSRDWAASIETGRRAWRTARGGTEYPEAVRPLTGAPYPKQMCTRSCRDPSSARSIAVDPVTPRLLDAGLDVRLVDLDDVGAGCDQVL